MMTVNLKHLVEDSADPTDPGSHMQLRTGSKLFIMLFGTESDGDPLVRLANSTTGSGGSDIQAGNKGQYNIYQLLDRDGTGGPQGAELWVNGVQVASDYAGGNLAQPATVAWGDLGFAAGQNGSASYETVRLETGAGLEPVPEPASLALLAAGALFALPRRKNA